MSAVEKSALGEFRQYWLWAPDWRVNPLSLNSDQHQFSPNNIHRLSRAKSRRINNWLQRYQSLIFYQTFSTNFLRKCKEISLGIFMWILGLKGLKAIPWNSGEFQSKPKICEQFDIFCGLTKSRKVFPPDPNCPGHKKKDSKKVSASLLTVTLLLLVYTWRQGGHVGWKEQKHFFPLGT